MQSRRESVLLPAKLIGMGLEANCTLNADRITIAGTDQYEYVHLIVASVPDDLPDGRYRLTFDGRTCEVQRLRRTWINHFWSV
jgi:hypothetical protein